MATPYNPGRYPGRAEFIPSGYDVAKEIRWQAYNKVYYALYEDRLHTLNPSPGFCFNNIAFDKWRDKFLLAMIQEAKSRGKSLARPLTIEAFPNHVWVWLYQRMLQAEKERIPVPLSSLVYGD